MVVLYHIHVPIFLIQVATTASPDVKAAGTGVLQAFKNTTTFMMPPPSDNVRKGSQGESLSVTGTIKTHTIFISVWLLIYLWICFSASKTQVIREARGQLWWEPIPIYSLCPYCNHWLQPYGVVVKVESRYLQCDEADRGSNSSIDLNRTLFTIKTGKLEFSLVRSRLLSNIVSSMYYNP